MNQPASMSVGARLARGSSWLLATRVLTNLFSFSSTLLLARILDPADFGLVALGTTVMAILTAVTDISLASALIQHPNPTVQHLHTAWSLNLARGIVIGAMLAAAAYPIAWVYGEPRLAGIIFALCAVLVINGMANPRAAMMAREMIFWQQFVLDVSQKITAMIVAVAVALLFRSYWALVAGLITGQLASTAASYALLPFRPRLSWRHTRELFGFSIWLTLGQIVNTINWRFDQLLVGGVGGRAALGHYTVGDGIAALPTREAITPLMTALFPALRKFAHDRAALARAYQASQRLVTAVILPLGVGIALVADPLVRLTMGARWLPAVFMIQMLGAVYALQTLGALGQTVALATGDTKLLFVRDLQSFLLRFPFVIVGMLAGGVVGIVYARVAAGTITIFFNMHIVRKLTGISIAAQILACWRTLASAAAMTLVLLLFSHGAGHAAGVGALLAQIAVMVTLGGATYVVADILLWMLAGRSEGPETTILRALAGFRTGSRIGAELRARGGGRA